MEGKQRGTSVNFVIVGILVLESNREVEKQKWVKGAEER
jgi:hypothetical protein